MNLHVIASGSKGNAAIVYDEKTHILIDIGISKQELINGLKEIKLSLKDIDFVLITHDHSDQIKNVHIFNMNICYAPLGVLPLKNSNILIPFHEYNFNSITVKVIKSSHDATNSCGFIFKNNNEELVYLTDTGYIPSETLKIIKNKDYYFIESNHDVGMLLESSRPNLLKRRILSFKGHLSNEQCAYYLVELVGEKTKKVLLAHISEECNSFEKIFETFEDVFNEENFRYKQIEFFVTFQHKSVDL